MMKPSWGVPESDYPSPEFIFLDLVVLNWLNIVLKFIVIMFIKVKLGYFLECRTKITAAQICNSIA